MKTYKNVDEYIAHALPAHQKSLITIRQIVKKTVPSATESIAYGMPAYTWKGKPLFYFAAMKGHLGIYPTPGPIQTCASLLTDFSTSKGCVRIPYSIPIPQRILVTLLKERKKEIQEKETPPQYNRKK